MKTARWNLIIGLLCTAATICDYIILEITMLTPILSFFAGSNLIYYLADKFVLSEKQE